MTKKDIFGVYHQVQDTRPPVAGIVTYNLLRIVESFMTRLKHRCPWSHLLIYCLVFISWTSTPGCKKEAPDKTVHWGAAQAYMESGDYDSAVIELRNVVQIDPSDDQAFHRLGECYLNTGRLHDAFKSFHRATLLNQENLEAQLNLGRLYLLAGNDSTAEEKARLILQQSPDHVEALTLMANLQALEKDTDAAIKTLERVVSLDPKRSRATISLARLYLETGEWGKADAAFQKAAELDPETYPPLQEGNEPFKSLPVLARYYEHKGMTAHAEAFYKQAADISTSTDVSALLDLALFYGRRGNHKASLDTLDRALALRKNDLDIMSNKAEILLDAGDTESAGRLVEDILRQYPRHVGALFLKGKMDFSKGAFEDALSCFEDVSKAKPKYALAHYHKGVTLLRLGRAESARESLEQVVRLDPDQIRTRLLLANSYITEYKQGNATLALVHIEHVLGRQPENREALTLLGNLKIRTRDYRGAEEVFQRIVKLYPGQSAGHFQLGLVHFLLGRAEDAVKSFQTALELDPGQSRALVLAVNILLKDGRHEEALALCDKIIPRLSGAPKPLAVAQDAKARAYIESGKGRQAEGIILEAIENDPNLLSAHVHLTALYLHDNRVDEVIAHFEKVLSEKPDFLAAYMVLGMIHDGSGDLEKANEYYRRALEIQPDFAPAANNLAWNLVTSGGDLDEAFRFARIAKAGMPEDPYVLDTMGWIYHLLGHHWKAVPELERAVVLQPNAPALHFRLGKVYQAAGDLEAARQSLERALALGDNFNGAEEARRVLKELKGRANENKTE